MKPSTRIYYNKDGHPEPFTMQTAEWLELMQVLDEMDARIAVLEKQKPPSE